ncbi:UDP-N-acetylmuramate dehydrogenase [bacterium D16-54]|nr:UDP-N-acetylmuramate dehydrogenase [bacterium D16-54]RKJ15057.1 UDP-N-acetylmuramate dehydrogenase [bacterium D16-56]
MSDFFQTLGQVLRAEQIRVREPMSRHTTFRAGGPADYYVEPETRQELAAVLDLCRQWGMPYYILGNGSNLLVGDKGYRGVMVALGKPWAEVEAEGCKIRAGAGALLSAAARLALKENLTGMEFASGIPGTVGGAVVMNAGAYGSELSDVLGQVMALTPEGQVQRFSSAELELGYRTSCVCSRRYVVLEAEFILSVGEGAAIRQRMEELAARRRARQPLEYPSAGSTFKRPPGYFAGKLIQEAGLSGFSVGDAQVSEKHCGFVINRGEAAASDILMVCREVQSRVLEYSGVELELEVKLLGDF